MDIRDLTDPAWAKFARSHRILAKRLVRNPSTGCLEYLGPPSQVAGNPMLHIDGGRRAIHLRRYIWILHHGPILKARFVQMRCGNKLCHLPEHMVLRSSFKTYSPSPKEYSSRFDRDTLSAIRFFDGKVSITALANVFRVNPTVIVGICNSKTVSKIIPFNWRPNIGLERQVENASCNYGAGFYLSPLNLRLALRDIRHSSLTPQTREIVAETLMGVSTRTLARRLRRSKNGVMYIYRRGLVSLENELGTRRWIKICSKNRMALWRKSPYARKSSRKKIK